MYDFDRTFDRHNTEVIKWDRLEKILAGRI